MVDAIKLLRRMRGHKTTPSNTLSPSTSTSASSSSSPMSSSCSTCTSAAAVACPFTGTEDGTGLTTRSYTLKGAGAVPAALRVFEDPVGTFSGGGGNGATLWDAALVLSRRCERSIVRGRLHGSGSSGNPRCELDNRAAAGSQDPFRAAAGSGPWAGVCAVELGAGVGLVAMVLGTLGAKVLATERPMALQLLRHNVEQNTLTGNVNVEALDWCAPDDFLAEAQPVVAAVAAGATGKGKDERCGSVQSDSTPTTQTPNRWADVDIVVGSDLAFPSNRDAYDALCGTIAAILRGSRRPGGAVAYLSHEVRKRKVEAEFWARLGDHGLQYSVVPAPAAGQGAGGDGDDDDARDITVFLIELQKEGESTGGRGEGGNGWGEVKGADKDNGNGEGKCGDNDGGEGEGGKDTELARCGSAS